MEKKSGQLIGFISKTAIAENKRAISYGTFLPEMSHSLRTQHKNMGAKFEHLFLTKKPLGILGVTLFGQE